MAQDLKSLLTADLFRLVFEAWVPFAPEEPIGDFGEAIQKFMFTPSDGPENARPRVWPCLEAISKVGLDTQIDWLSFLPPVEDPDFPTQALGLQLLLDQAPRSYLKGVDARWTNAYFDQLSVKYALALVALPSDVRPSSWERWKDSSSFEYYVLVYIMYIAPIVHSEKLSDTAVALNEQLRLLIEERCNTRDPLRDLPEQRWDLYGFPKLWLSQGPKSPCDVAKGGFWLLNLFDVHKPPLDKYGRYPYRNWVLGRDMTEEEEVWIEEGKMFKPPPDEVIKKIREDVENGVWSPLGSGSAA